MAAAVARPPLFTHLVASNPTRDSGSLKATAISVALHAGLIGLALYATQQVRQPPRVVENVTTMLPALPVDASPVQRSATAPASSGSSTLAPPVMPAPPALTPTIDPRLAQSDLFTPLSREFVPTPSAPATRGGTPGESGSYDPGGNFTAFTVGPQLLNRADVSRLLGRHYPSMLSNAGIGGTVVTWIKIDENGKVVETRVSKSSGHSALDAAALKVAEAMRFSPAFNRDTRVPVWVELPIVFTAK